MERLLIIAAIIVAVLLLSGSIVPPCRPNFSLSEKQSEYGLFYRLSALGAACEKTERGNGISTAYVCRTVKRSVKNVYKKLDDGVGLEYFERVLADNAERISAAAAVSARGLRFGYKLGHVGGAPRLFLFCSELVRSTGGQIDGELIYKSLKTFSARFELSYGELALLNDCLLFCLCGYICAFLDLAERRQRSYERGVDDGAKGKLDLDSVKKNDYVCGLFAGSTTADYSAFERIAEINGTDRAEAERSRRLFFARACAAIEQCALSIERVTRLDKFPFEFSRAHDALSSDILYLESDEEVKRKYLSYVRSVAVSRGCDEKTAADELIKNNGSRELLNKVYRKNKAVSAWIAVNVLPIIFVGATIFLLFATATPFAGAFSAAALFTVYSGGYRLLSVVLSDRLKPLESVFIKPPSKMTVQAYKAARSIAARVTPIAELVSMLFCAYAFSPTALFVTCAVFVFDALSCVFCAASELSIKRLFGVFSAFERFIIEPPTAPLSVAESICEKVGIKKKLSDRAVDAIKFALKFTVGVVVMCLDAIVSRSAVMTVLGALVVFGTVSGEVKDKALKLFDRARAAARKRKNDGKSVAVLGSIIPSVRYFGGETEYRSNELKSDGVTVFTDNRGGIRARLGGNDLNIGVSVKTSGEVITTETCHGAFERHRTVYKFVSGELEFSAEIVPSVNMRACFIRASICNRTAEKRRVELSVALSGISDMPRREIEKDGAIAVGKSALGAFIIGRTVDARSDDGELTVSAAVDIGATQKQTRLIAVVADRDVRAVKHALLSVNDNYYAYECSAADAYAHVGGNVSRAASTFLPVPSYNFEASADAGISDECETALFYTVPTFSPTAYAGADGDAESDGMPPAAVENIFCDGETYLQITGKGRASLEHTGAGETAGADDAFITLGDDGDVWSLSRVVHERASSLLIGDRNGCKCALTVFMPSNSGGAVFDLTMENASDCERAIDVMLSFTPRKSMLPVKLSRGERRVDVISRSGSGLCITASAPIIDCTPYLEGYKKYGAIDRASGFRTGGSTIAPAVSTRVNIAGGGSGRAVFCIAARTELCRSDNCDLSAARLLGVEQKLYESLFDVVLRSSDIDLNDVFSHSVVMSYKLGMREQMTHGLNTFGLKLEKLLSLYKICDADKSSVGADILLCAAARYKMGDFSAAYKSLDMFVKGVLCGNIEPDAMAYSLFRALVTERLLGISMSGDNIRLCPSTCDSTPHIEFELVGRSGKTRVVVGDGGEGAWRIRIGRITYLSDTIRAGEHDLPVILEQND